MFTSEPRYPPDECDDEYEPEDTEDPEEQPIPNRP